MLAASSKLQKPLVDMDIIGLCNYSIVSTEHGDSEGNVLLSK